MENSSRVPTLEAIEKASEKFWEQNPELAAWRDQLLADLRSGKINKIPAEFVAKALGGEIVDRSEFIRIIPPGSYTRETLPPISPEAQRILDEVYAKTEAERKRKSEKGEI